MGSCLSGDLAQMLVDCLSQVGAGPDCMALYGMKGSGVGQVGPGAPLLR